MMIWLGKLLIAWLVAILAVPVLADLRQGRRGRPLPSRDGILGFGLLVGLPMLLFGLLVALPVSLLAARIMPPPAAALLAPLLTTGAAWLLCATLPEGWKGARQVLILFALILGTALALLNLVLPRSAAVA